MAKDPSKENGLERTYKFKLCMAVFMQVGAALQLFNPWLRHMGHGINMNFYLVAATVIPVGIVAMFLEKSLINTHFSKLDAVGDIFGPMLAALLGEAASFFALASNKSTFIEFFYVLFGLGWLAIMMLANVYLEGVVAELRRKR